MHSDDRSGLRVAEIVILEVAIPWGILSNKLDKSTVVIIERIAKVVAIAMLQLQFVSSMKVEATSTCGQTSSENCTYFESTGSEIGACQLEICRCSSNVCQLRLDFNTFTISGPSSATQTVGLLKFGVLNTASGSPAVLASQCLTDTFSVTNPSGGRCVIEIDT